MTNHGFFFATCGLAALTVGCRPTAESRPPVVEVRYAATPVVVDGRLDDSVWGGAPTYALGGMVDGGRRTRLQEGGSARFAWDDKYFYVALESTDSDVVTESDANGLDQFRLGDVGEAFLKPEGSPWDWELHVTPRGNQTSYFFPSSGRRLPGCKLSVHRLTVGARIDGTLNDAWDRDRGWTAEMAIPRAMLTEHGNRFGPGSRWRLLVGRYNFSITLDNTELSSMPEISQVNFHLTREYATLRFTPTDPP